MRTRVSIRKNRLKLLIALGVMVAGLILGTIALRKLAGFVVSFQQGADLSAALNLVQEIKPELSVELRWLLDDRDTGRHLEPYMRDSITSDYMHAWQGVRMAYLLEREVANLRTYFVGSAYTQTHKAITDARAEGLLIRQKDYGHTLKLHFYSANRSVVSFSDHNFTLVRQIRGGEGGDILDITEERLSADVVMFYNEGYWQIRNFHLTEISLPQIAPLSPQDDDFARVQDGQLLYRGEILKLRGFNYYPQETPWYEFWPEFDPDIIAKDMDIMLGLGSNTVRIFVPFDQFGFDPVDETYLDNLETFLDMARERQLFVIVTLFDRRTEYSLETWPAGDAHLAEIIPRFAEHPAILAWDMKNEGDKDYEHFAERAEIIAWLKHTAAVIRSMDANHLLTAGWFSPETVSDTAPYVDFFSFHYFDYPDKLPDFIQALQTEYPHKPILLEEFGAHTRYGLHPDAHTEAEQAYYYAQIIKTAQTFDLAGTLAWTLYDFPDVLTSLGKKGDSVENHLGLIRVDGTLKPAVSQFIPNGKLDVAPPTLRERLSKPLYRLTIIVGGSITSAISLAAAGWFIYTFWEYINFALRLLWRFIVVVLNYPLIDIWLFITRPFRALGGRVWRWMRRKSLN